MKIIQNVRAASPAGLTALVALLAGTTSALSQAFDATPATAMGAVTYDRATPGVEIVTINVGGFVFPARIVWTPAGATFLPAGHTATFVGGPGNSDFRLVNAVAPTGADVILAGAVVGAPVWPFGDIAFEASPGEGIVVAAGASMDVTQLVLRAGLVTIQAGSIFSPGTALSVEGDLSLSGAVQIGNGGLFGELTGNALLAGGALTFNRLDNVTYAGTIGGNGQVAKAGAGVLTLTGISTFTGSTSINAGVLSVSADASLGAAASSLIFNGGTLSFTGALSTARSVAANATAIIDAQAAVELTGIVSGPGGLTKTGPSPLFLSNAANAYLGATTVAQGGLLSAGAIPDGSATVVAGGAALALSASDVIGSLSGAGSAGSDGGGNRTLTVGGGNGSAVFSGVLSDLAAGFPGVGQLAFAKTGQGTQTLTGSNTYTGSTTVSGGTLLVNGSITASSGVAVNAGATLGGNGFVPAATINGMLAPGNSIGTITIVGNLSFSAGSTYAVEVSPAAADLTNVTGTANLSGGAVAASFGAGIYSNRRYTILTAAGGLGGTAFTGISDNAPGVNTSLAYDGNNVYLDTELVLAEMPQAPGGPPLNPNQRAVARAVDAYLAANGSVPAAFAILDANGLTQVSGEIATAAMSAGMNAAGQFLGVMSDPFVTNAGATSVPAAAGPAAYSGRPAALSSYRALAALGGEKVAASDAANAALSMSSAHAADAIDIASGARWKLWGTVYGAGIETGGDPAVAGSADLSSRNWGVATGFGRGWGDGAGGLALGGAGSAFDLSGGLGSGSAGTFNAGLYAGQTFGNAYLSGALAYGWHNTRTVRAVPGDILTGRFNAHTFSGRIEAGYRIDTAFAIVTPYAGVQATSYTLPAYVETSAAGGAFAVAHARQSEVFARTELGLKAEHAVPTSSATIKLSGRVAWGYNATNDRSVTGAFVALPGQSFTITGARPDRHAALIDLGIEAAFDSGLAAKLSFSGEFSGNVASYGAAAKLSYRW
jgi:fibronectin-binding autotransporter adhesin